MLSSTYAYPAASVIRSARFGLPRDLSFLSETEAPRDALLAAARRAADLGVAPHHQAIAEGSIRADDYAAQLARRFGLGVLGPHLRLVGGQDVALVMRSRVARVVTAHGEEGVLIGLDPAHVATILDGLPRGSASRIHVGALAAFEAFVIAQDPAGVDAAITKPQTPYTTLHSAERTLNTWQAAVYAATLVMIGEALAFGAMGPLVVFLWACSAVVAVSIAEQAMAILSRRRPETPVPGIEAPPRYTILAPLYREGAVVGKLVAALDRLDYPRSRLEVILLVEAGDRETIAAIEAFPLPAHMRTLISPAGRLRTKPRALNLGLLAATGEHLVVYDAEDDPDPDQLRIAAARFAAAPARVACLQARLQIENPDDGLVPALFAIDYAGLFSVHKPGCAAARQPVPLGGTSNHFRATVLRELGGWDASNVTEDAELGLRLFAHGLDVETIESITWEEAPLTPSAWFRQRRR